MRITIGGAWLTKTCRSMVLEKNWTGALQILMEGLEGFTWNQAIGVLSGNGEALRVKFLNPAYKETGEELS